MDLLEHEKRSREAVWQHVHAAASDIFMTLWAYRPDLRYGEAKLYALNFIAAELSHIIADHCARLEEYTKSPKLLLEEDTDTDADTDADAEVTWRRKFAIPHGSPSPRSADDTDADTVYRWSSTSAAADWLRCALEHLQAGRGETDPLDMAAAESALDYLEGRSL